MIVPVKKYKQRAGHGGYGNASVDDLSLHLPLDDSGPHLLSRVITLNGNILSPTYRYTGNSATVATWAAEVGDNLSQASSGTDPSINQTTPLLNTNAQAVIYQGGDVHQSAAASGDLTTLDFYIEGYLLPKNTGGVQTLFSTQNGTANPGYSCGINASGVLDFTVRDSSGATTVACSATNDLSWVWFAIAGDRSENSNNGLLIYLNEINLGAGNISTRALTLAGHRLTIGSLADFNQKANGCGLAYLALYQGANIFPGGASNVTVMGNFLADRYKRFLGFMPTRANGADVPISFSRTGVCFSEKYESSLTRFHRISTTHPRLVSRSGGSGYLAEPAATNLVLQCTDLTHATWTKAELTASSTSTESPIKGINWTKLVESDNNAFHGAIQYSQTPPSATVIFSAIAKKGGAAGRNYLTFHIYRETPAVATFVTFNLNTGAVHGNTGTPTLLDSGMIDLGGGSYRCWGKFDVTDTTALGGIYLGPTDGSGTLTFDGDATTYADGVYVCHVQFENNNGTGRPTSPIYTTTASVERGADSLRYDGDDGNLGGIGSNQNGRIQFKVLADNYNFASNAACVTLSDGGATADAVKVYINSTDVPIGHTRATGGNNGDTTGTTDVFSGSQKTIDLKYKKNSLRLLVGGTQEGSTDTTCDIPDDLDRIDIGQNESGAEQAGVLISQVKIWKSYGSD